MGDKKISNRQTVWIWDAMQHFHLVKHKRWVSFNAHWGWKWAHRKRLCLHMPTFEIDNIEWLRERKWERKKKGKWEKSTTSSRSHV